MDVRRNSTAKEFHAVGPVTENELSAKRLDVRGCDILLMAIFAVDHPSEGVKVRNSPVVR